MYVYIPLNIYHPDSHSDSSSCYPCSHSDSSSWRAHSQSVRR